MQTVTSKLPIFPGSAFATTLPELVAARLWAQQQCAQFNALLPTELASRRTALADIVAKAQGVSVASTIEVEYGVNTLIGKGTFLNHHVQIVDACRVAIGNRVLIGPNSVISTVVGRYHVGPKDEEELALPIVIGHRVWIGANVRIAAGVTIGDNAVIGAGSTVVDNVAANTLVFGNPAIAVRKINQTPQ